MQTGDASWHVQWTWVDYPWLQAVAASTGSLLSNGSTHGSPVQAQVPAAGDSAELQVTGTYLQQQGESFPFSTLTLSIQQASPLPQHPGGCVTVGD